MQEAKIRNIIQENEEEIELDNKEEERFNIAHKKELNYINYILDKQNRYLMPQELIYKQQFIDKSNIKSPKAEKDNQKTPDRTKDKGKS